MTAERGVAYHYFQSPVFAISLRPTRGPYEVLIAAGGGGSSRTGIPNTVAVIGFADGGVLGEGSVPAAVSNSLRPLRLHDVTTGDQLVLAVAMSPDGRTAAATAGRDVILYRLRRGTEPSIARRASFCAMEPGVDADAGLCAVAWFPDGRRIAVGGDDGVVSVWMVAPEDEDHSAAATGDGSAAGSATPTAAAPPSVVRQRKGTLVTVEDGTPERRPRGSMRTDTAAAVTAASPGARRTSIVATGGSSADGQGAQEEEERTGAATLVARFSGASAADAAPTEAPAPKPAPTANAGVEALAVLELSEEGLVVLAAAGKDGRVRVWELAQEPESNVSGYAASSAADAVVHTLPGVGAALVGDATYAPRQRRGAAGRQSAGPWAVRTVAFGQRTGGANGSAPPLFSLESSQRGAAIVARWERVVDGVAAGAASKGKRAFATSTSASVGSAGSARTNSSWRCVAWSLVATRPVSAMALAPSPLPQFIALGTSDGSLLLLDAPTLKPLAWPEYMVQAATPRRGVLPSLLAACHLIGPPVGELPAVHGFPVTTLAFMPGRGVLASGAADAQVAFVPLPTTGRTAPTLTLMAQLMRGIFFVVAALLVLGLFLTCVQYACTHHGVTLDRLWLVVVPPHSVQAAQVCMVVNRFSIADLLQRLSAIVPLF